MKTKMMMQVPMDTSCVSPDSLKAAFEVAVDVLGQRAERAGSHLNWNRFEMALHESGPDTTMVVRTETL